VRDFTKGTLKILGWIAAGLAVVLVVLRVGFVDVITVGHNGMAPTIIAGEQVALWRGAKIETGDIALCAHPGQADRYVLARVIARPGQRVSSERGQLLVNGEVVRSDIRETKRFYDVATRRTDRYRYAIEMFGNNTHPVFLNENTTFELPERRVRTGLFVLGDNRGYRGEDSRTYGEVDESTCKGVVFLRLVPVLPDSDGGGPNGTSAGDDLEHGWLDYLR
jgi:signal peptidase I